MLRDDWDIVWADKALRWQSLIFVPSDKHTKYCLENFDFWETDADSCWSIIKKKNEIGVNIKKTDVDANIEKTEVHI